MTTPTPTPTHFLLSTPLPHVTHVQINRPAKRNAFTPPMWRELRDIFNSLSRSPDTHAVILSGAGDKAFTAGLDVQAASQQSFLQPPKPGEQVDVAQRATEIRHYIEVFQDCVSSIEAFENPVICILHGTSYGLAIDIACCADIRLCSTDARMAVKEVDLGLAADIGTLSRLPKIVGNASWVKDVCFTARTFGAEEALRVGFVSEVREGKEEALKRALEIAECIAGKSEVAVRGTKELLNHARDNGVGESLKYTRVWNAAMVQGGDVVRAMDGALGRGRGSAAKL